MTVEPKIALRLQFLTRVVRKECKPSPPQTSACLGTCLPWSRQPGSKKPPSGRAGGSLCGRFGRLQDTVGDKLLPLLLAALGEKPSAAIDNLDRAERLGLLKSADEWMTMRNLRNQMVHEYVEDPIVFSAPCKLVMLLCQHS